MADETPEPIHPLEAGLRAQAAKRRAELGAIDPEMPGPMRAQLHSEISRQTSREDRARVEQPGFLAWFFQWQRALATVGVTLLLIGLFAWNDGWFERRAVTVAKQAAPSEAPSAATNSIAMSDADALNKRLDTPRAEMDQKEQSKPAVSAPAPADAVAAGKLEEAPKVAQPDSPTVAAAPPASEPRSEVFASRSAAVAGLRQNFVQSPAQVAERARRAPAAGVKDERTASLLNAFEFRQDGNRIEIIDADGSIYAGEIELRMKKDKGLAATGRDQAASAPAGTAKLPATKSKNEEIAAQFNFRASGVNNTLRQKVTIQGVYQESGDLESQNAPGAIAAGGTTAQDALKAGRPAELQRQAQSRARVIGRAQVNGRDVEVNAEATK
jgi:hypothetical protein